MPSFIKRNNSSSSDTTAEAGQWSTTMDTILTDADSYGEMDDGRVEVSPTRTLVLDSQQSRENPFNQQEAERSARRPVDLGAHCHPAYPPPPDRSAERTLVVISCLTAFFIVGEVTGGALSNSTAIMSDAAHMLSDLFSFLISLFAIRISRKSPTKAMSFGFYRAEVLGAVCSIIIIWVLTGILVYMAAMRLTHPDTYTIEPDYMLVTACCGVLFNIITKQNLYMAAMRLTHPDTYTIEPDYMLVTACCGVLFNIIMGLVLHRGGHAHSHGGLQHTHSHENGAEPPRARGGEREEASGEEEAEGGGVFVGGRRRRGISITAYPNEDVMHVKKQKNLNIRAAFVHVIGDLCQSVGVLIAAMIVKFKGLDYKMADPICTFFFSVLVLITTVTVLRDAVRVLMEGTPRDVAFEEVRGSLSQVEGVRTVHSLHLWSLTMDKAALAVHLAIDSTSDPLIVMQRASRLMRSKYNLAFTTIQVEPYDQTVMNSCSQCIGPSR